MTYEQQFLKYRKDYLDKIKKKAPSQEAIDAIEHEKFKSFVKKLDQHKGKPFVEMDRAGDEFESNRLIYLRTIASKVESNLKSSVNKFGEILRKIGEDFQDACQAQRESEKPPPPPPMPKPKAAEKPTGGVAAAAVKIMLGKVSEGYKKFRQGQLDMTTALEKDCLDQRKQIEVLVDALEKEVKQAVAYSQGGRVREAAVLKISAQGQVKKINIISAGVRKNCDVSLDSFQKGRNLKAEVIAKKLQVDLPDDDVKELAKIPGTHAKILNNASARAAAAERVAKECEAMADHAASLQSQISDIADGKDFGKVFLDGAMKMSVRVKTLLDKAIAEAEKLQKIVIPGLVKNVKIVEDKVPAERVSAAQAYVNNNVRQVTLSMAECIHARTTAGNLIAAEKGKIPPQILNGQAGKLIEQSETLLSKLVELNVDNAEKATDVLASARKLAK